nr:hypothetical protein [Candidatus Sigynarchaeota archaeon]
MPNITLSIPEAVYKIMSKHKEIRWSEIARRAIMNFSRKIEWLDEIERKSLNDLYNDLFKDSELTEDEANKIGELAKESIYKRLVEKSK